MASQSNICCFLSLEVRKSLKGLTPLKLPQGLLGGKCCFFLDAVKSHLGIPKRAEISTVTCSETTDRNASWLLLLPWACRTLKVPYCVTTTVHLKLTYYVNKLIYIYIFLMGLPVVLLSNGKYSSNHRYLMEILCILLLIMIISLVEKLPRRGQRQFITVNMMRDFYWTLYFFYCDQSDAVIVWWWWVQTDLSALLIVMCVFNRFSFSPSSFQIVLKWMFPTSCLVINTK